MPPSLVIFVFHSAIWEGEHILSELRLEDRNDGGHGVRTEGQEPMGQSGRWTAMRDLVAARSTINSAHMTEPRDTALSRGREWAPLLFANITLTPASNWGALGLSDFLT